MGGSLRLGLIGLGRIGAFHARTLSELPGVASLVVTDAVPAVTTEVAERVGAEALDSPAELLAADVDGVLIAAATDAHPELLLAAVEAGLPTFCEKPLARTATDALAVAERVARDRRSRADRVSAPVRPGLPRRPCRSGER
jgi:myo-inositol 2-dehydrogenase / D-chiro-inositol 1-dehydrogenase